MTSVRLEFTSLVLVASCANATQSGVAGEAVVRAVGAVAEAATPKPAASQSAARLVGQKTPPPDTVATVDCGDRYYLQRCPKNEACFFERDDGGRFECRDEACSGPKTAYLATWCDEQRSIAVRSR